MHICDWVLRAVDAELAAHPPERGGALLGPVGRPLVTRFLADLEGAARELGGAADAFLSDAGTGPMPAGRLRLDGAEVLVLASDLYPALPPALLVTSDGRTEQLHVPWQLDAPEEDRLARALRAAFTPPGPPFDSAPDRGSGQRQRHSTASPLATGSCEHHPDAKRQVHAARQDARAAPRAGSARDAAAERAGEERVRGVARDGEEDERPAE